LIVRITQFLLSITIMLSITFTIYQGVRYILSWASLADEGDARTKLFNIVRWIVIALSSVMLIFLVQSLTISSITSDPKPLRDQWYPTATNTKPNTDQTNPSSWNTTPAWATTTDPNAAIDRTEDVRPNRGSLFSQPLDNAIAD
jgi:hypothetical protein